MIAQSLYCHASIMLSLCAIVITLLTCKSIIKTAKLSRVKTYGLAKFLLILALISPIISYFASLEKLTIVSANQNIVEPLDQIFHHQKGTGLQEQNVILFFNIDQSNAIIPTMIFFLVGFPLW